MTQPQGKTIRELHAIVAEDSARFDRLAAAWSNLLPSEQEALTSQAERMAQENNEYTP